ncbi:hypothetical protein ACLOJK_032161 [Asimina triloba]
MPSSPAVHSPPPSSASRDSTPSSWFPYHSAGDFQANLVMILIILICALVSALALNAAIRCFLRRHRRRQQAEPSDASTAKPARSSGAVEIRSLPALVFSAGMNMAGAEAECAICLSEFVNGEGIRVLPRCRHGFHVKCIEGWLAARTSCPTCRTSCLTASPEKDNSAGHDVEAPLEAAGRMAVTAPEASNTKIWNRPRPRPRPPIIRQTVWENRAPQERKLGCTCKK